MTAGAYGAARRRQGARRGNRTCPASNFAEATDIRLILSRSGLTAIAPEIIRFNSWASEIPVPASSMSTRCALNFAASLTAAAFSAG